MLNEAAMQLATNIRNSERFQGEIQPYFNKFASSIAELAQRDGCEFTVEELGHFLAETMFPDGPSTDNQWDQMLYRMLNKIRIVDSQHRMFKTMAAGSVEGGLTPEMEAAIEKAKARQRKTH